MSNVFAIAQKELKSYFASPIAYIIIGFFALVFGYFYFVSLIFFSQASLQMGMPGAGQVNIHTMMIRPLLQNVSVVALFVLPLITMRTYSEEKRSGTIELLLTSPVTDTQIILGKFFGALGLFGLMLAVTLVHIAILFVYGNPEWKPIASGYLGSAAHGCVIPIDRSAHLEPDQEPDRRRHGDICRSSSALDARLDGRLGRTDHAESADGAFHHRPFRRLFTRRHRRESSRLLPELHHVRVVSDGEVGRQRTLARVILHA